MALNKHTIVELKELAKTGGVSLTGITKKADIIAAINQNKKKKSSKVSPKKSKSKTTGKGKWKFIPKGKVFSDEGHKNLYPKVVYSDSGNEMAFHFGKIRFFNDNNGIADLEMEQNGIVVFFQSKGKKVYVIISNKKGPMGSGYENHFVAKYDPSFETAMKNVIKAIGK